MEKRNLCGPYIKQFRLKRRLTLDDLAACLKIESDIVLDRTNMGRIENGHRSVSDYELVAFANIFGVPLEQLLPPDVLKKKG